MSRSVYAVGLVLMQVLSFLFMFASFHPDVQRSSDSSLIVLACSLTVSFVGATLFLTLVYRAWARIQDGHAATTPGKAAGFLLIPFFNLYWVFFVLAGYASDYRRYAERHGIADPPRLSTALLAAYGMLILLPFPVISWIVTWFAVTRLVDAANAAGGHTPAPAVTAKIPALGAPIAGHG